MYTFACGLERTPGTGGEEGKILNWSVGEEEGRGGHSSLPRSQSIFRSPGFVRMRFPGNRSYRLLRNPTVAWDIARTLPMKTQKDDCCIPSCPPLHDPPRPLRSVNLHSYPLRSQQPRVPGDGETLCARQQIHSTVF